MTPAATDAARGLSSAEAARRLAADGPNATPSADAPAWRRMLVQFWAPVPWALEVAIVFQLALREYLEAGLVASLLAFNAALGFFQESRAQATLQALKARLALTASVKRDGAWILAPTEDLVVGDIVKLSLGSVVPADVRLVDGAALLDQSTLTGESLPIEAAPGFETFAGALVRRGEATAEVTATGARTRFGRAAELVRDSRSPSAEQTAVLAVVRNLAIFNGLLVVLQLGYSLELRLSPAEIGRVVLTAVLAAVPVALPATFTLASALAARSLAARGVLPTRLSAVEEAAGMDLLCADKTGTLTRNELAVAAVRPLAGFDEARVLALAALASSEAGQDPVDAAIRKAAAASATPARPSLLSFTPFDPARKMSEALALDATGGQVRVFKGAYATISAMASDEAAEAAARELQAQGFRVLAVAASDPTGLRIAGLVALSDPPRDDAAGLIADLRKMGVRTVMVTGDSAATAEVVARAVGLTGEIHAPGAADGAGDAERFDVFAGVFPEDKFNLVKTLQAHHHTVGMCGDGANDAPALRQAQMGVAVSTATDVAKSAAGIVLTEPGLAGVVAAVREGRSAFQRILTYTLRSLTGKINQVLFLTVGLAMTGRSILTPTLMVLIMTTGDFLAMASTTDRVRASPKPDAWRIDALTIAAVAMGIVDLAFCSAVLAIGKFLLCLPLPSLRTLAAVTLVFSTQAVLYVVRERRRLWSSRPSGWLALSSVADVAIISTLATRGVLMAPLPFALITGVLAASAALALALDAVKGAAFRALKLT
jgi:H+-transporting ATPase